MRILLILVLTGCLSKGAVVIDSGDTDANLTDADGDGYTTEDGDCDDSNDAVSPGTEEICDGIDNNCNDWIDEDVTETFYADSDGDGYGDEGSTVVACDSPDGYVSVGDDCDDTAAAAFPGNAESCDGVDNNCDGEADEGLTETFYADSDGDGYGDGDDTMVSCTPLSGYVEDTGDCDDTAPTIFPGAAEVCDGLDNNCDGLDDTLGLWSFESGAGSVAYDSGGLGLDGDIDGATWTTTGYSGNALDFDGISSSVVLDHSALAPESGLTLSVWVMPDTLHSDSWNPIISRGASGSSQLGCCGDSYLLGYYQYDLSLYTDTGNVDSPLIDGGGYTDHTGSWHHIVSTWDVDTGARALYLDGVLTATDTDGPPLPYYDGTPTRIGGDTNNGVLVLPFDGVIDEVKIFDCALGAKQAARDHASGWPF
jgi:hypothetical protein